MGVKFPGHPQPTSKSPEAADTGIAKPVPDAMTRGTCIRRSCQDRGSRFKPSSPFGAIRAARTAWACLKPNSPRGSGQRRAKSPALTKHLFNEYPAAIIGG
jgi:hypothetical protein